MLGIKCLVPHDKNAKFWTCSYDTVQKWSFLPKDTPELYSKRKNNPMWLICCLHFWIFFVHFFVFIGRISKRTANLINDYIIKVWFSICNLLFLCKVSTIPCPRVAWVGCAHCHLPTPQLPVSTASEFEICFIALLWIHKKRIKARAGLCCLSPPIGRMPQKLTNTNDLLASLTTMVKKEAPKTQQ